MKERLKQFLKTNKINVKKALLISSLFILLVFIYFSFLPVISPDSSNYYFFMKIIAGDIPLSAWNPVRGPGTPFVLYLITRILGDNVIGFLVGSFLSYLVLLFFIYLIIKEINKLYRDKISSAIVWYFFVTLIVFNPLAIGYYHAMLTEFVATTIAIVGCFLAYKWVDVEFEKSRTTFLLYVIIFSFLSAFVWFLKQPYLSIILFPLFISTMLSIIKRRNTKNILSKILSFVFIIVSLVASINMWNYFLVNKGGVSLKGRGAGDLLSTGLIPALSNFRVRRDLDTINESYIDGIVYLEELEKNKIKDIIRKDLEDEEYLLYDVINIKGDIVDTIVWFRTSKNPVTVTEALHFIWEQVKEYPVLCIDSYITNYLATINVFATNLDNYLHYFPVKTFTEGSNENRGLSLAILLDRPIYWWAPDDAPYKITYMPEYEKINEPNELAKNLLSINVETSLFLFKIVFFFSPFAFMYFTVLYVLQIYKKGKSKNVFLYQLLIVLFGTSFLHVLLHAITGAIIDRYAFVAYPLSLLGMILLFKLKEYKVK